MSSSDPRPYSNTDTQEQMALLAFLNAINLKFVKGDLKIRDKVPNIDGPLELVDEAQKPRGKFDVQLKALPANSTRYSCPSSLVGYSRVSTLPLVLICADPISKRVFWRQITTHMPEYKPGQASFTINFDEIADSVVHDGVYLFKWAEMVREYQERISNYPVLVQKLSDMLQSGIDHEDKQYFQTYIRAINELLEGDFSAVKDIRFPGREKLGVGIFDWNDKRVHYQHFRVPFGEERFLVRKLDKSKSLFHSKQPIDGAISDHVSPRSELFDPETNAEQFLVKELKRIARQKKFFVHGRLLSADLLITFVDKYHVCLGLQPNQLSYQVAEVNYALHSYLPGVCAAVVSASNGNVDEFVYFDIEDVNTIVLSRGLKPIPPTNTLMRFKLSSGRFSMRAVYDALRVFLASGATSIDRLLAPRTQPLTPDDHWIWSGYSVEDELRNVSTILLSSVAEYADFVRGNRLNFPDSYYFNPDIAIVHEYLPVKAGKQLYGPTLYTTFVENYDHRLPKLSLRILKEASPWLHYNMRSIIRIEDQEYQTIGTSEQSADFLFQDTAFTNLIYEMLQDDLEKHYV